jgi:hypothetical protein
MPITIHLSSSQWICDVDNRPQKLKGRMDCSSRAVISSARHAGISVNRNTLKHFVGQQLGVHAPVNSKLPPSTRISTTALNRSEHGSICSHSPHPKSRETWRNDRERYEIEWIYELEKKNMKIVFVKKELVEYRKDHGFWDQPPTEKS